MKTLLVLLLTTVAVTAGSAGYGQRAVPSSSPSTAKERQELKRDTQAQAQRDYDKMKEDAMQLMLLSRSVSDQISTTGGMILSVKTLKDLEKIEQLAKKLRTNLKDK